MINFKRFVSGILSLVMVMFMFESIPVYAKTGTETYTYEGYTVEYIVSNEWTGNQSVEVKITNTGEESILNWALKYDAKGEISGLWNAVSVSDEETVYLIKNSGYNYEIAPNESVTFGYTLSGENLSVPEKFELCSKRVDTKEENYNAVLDITEEWDTGFKAELIVSNISDFPLEAWRFSFDSNFTVSDIWDCRLLENTDGRYTVASEAWINPIQPGSSVTIGIVGIKEEGKAPEISSVTLSEVVIDDTLPEVQEPVGEMFIAAFGECIKETETIDILWMSTQTEGTFEILMSDDNEEYTVAGSVQNADNYSIPADFVKKYIKVRQTNGNQTAESEPFVVMMTPTGYTVDFIDSDNDGLYDYIEDAVGTDKNLSDTDNDDLTDYEEVYLLGTDPMVYDSIVSGTSDGDADPDNDGLSNRYELDNGTNPLYDDTDSDGLTDGEEIGTYGTDPVKYDTDEDNIGDGDEITLGLNPLDSSTDGTLDNERIFEQKITSDSDIMSHINTEDNAFSMSIDISAAGNAENSISVSESGYSAVIQSDAVLGTIPEISYASGLSVEEVRVNFEIKDEYLENTLGTYPDCEELSGIKRLNIFRYFEEENILLPVETKFDIENNMVYTDVDMVGTYCLIDMEKWFESIGVSEDNSVSETEEYVSVSEEIETYENTPALMSLDVENKFTEVYYHVFYHTSISESRLPEVRKIVKNNYRSELSREDYHFYFINTNGEYVTTDSGKEYAETIEELEEILENITPEDICSDITDEMLIEHLNSEDRQKYLKDNSEKYIELINSPALSVLEDRARIRTSGYGYSHDPKIVSAAYDIVAYDYYYYENYIRRYINRQEIVMKFSLDSSELIPEEEKPLQILVATGLEPLPVDFDSKDDYDNDGLLNTKEIDWNSPLIKDKSLKTYESLPTVQECIDYFKNTKELTYVGNGLERFKTSLSKNKLNQLLDKLVLIVKSDPTKTDSDGDGLLDGKPIERGNTVIAPADQNPLEYDGPIGAWKNHIENARKSDIPTSLEDWYDIPERILNNQVIDFGLSMPNTGTEGILAFRSAYINCVRNGQIVVTDEDEEYILSNIESCINKIISTGDDWEIDLSESNMGTIYMGEYQRIMKKVGECIVDEENKDKILAGLGSRLLNFKADNQGVIHSQNKQWQSIGGYNNFYDNVFNVFTEGTMRREKFSFVVEGVEFAGIDIPLDIEYILWIWRGNYLNLGPGSEIGIYYRPAILSSDPEKLDPYLASTNLVLPMDMYLYNYKDSENMDLITAWNPDEDQWWICSFNPNVKYEDNRVENQIMIGSVDFSNHEEMYSSLKTRVKEDTTRNLEQYIVFDDNNKTIWICWCDGGLIR